MALFNKKTEMRELNQAGMPGFKRLGKKAELVSVVLNALTLKNIFYENGAATRRRIEGLAQKVMAEDPLFVMKLSVYARTELQLRSVATLLNICIAENIKGKQETKKALLRTLIRPDDALELVALWNHRHPGIMIPNAMRKAIREALEKNWDAYQLKKYFGGRNAVKVPDLIKLAHPRPRNDEQALMFKQAIEGSLPSIATAQTINAGNTGGQRAESYLSLLREGKLGLMAALKNIKNILQAGSLLSKEDGQELVARLADLLRNKQVVQRARVLPFRYYDAYTSVTHLSGDLFDQKAIADSLVEGFRIACKNVELTAPGERIAILIDDSGSMSWGDSSYMFKNAVILASAIDQNVDNSIVVFFSDTARVDTATVRDLRWAASRTPKGRATRIAEAIRKVMATQVDKMIILTDMQQNALTYTENGDRDLNAWVEKYKERHGSNIKVLFWNLAPYGGPSPILFGNNVLEVSGFSEKMLQVISLIWEDRNALINKIDQIII